jgi:hypothetical protein
MEKRRTFQFLCNDRISAIVTKDHLEELGFFVEPPGEQINRQSRHQHKKSGGRVTLIFFIPPDIQEDTVEMNGLEFYVEQLAFNNPGQVIGI